MTPLGFKYYEFIMERQGESINKVEDTITSYLHSQYFQSKYHDAFEKWTEAEKKLWKSETNKQLTVIGHLCREAVQLYVSELLDLVKPETYDQNITHTVSRLRSILEF